MSSIKIFVKSGAGNTLVLLFYVKILMLLQKKNENKGKSA